MPENQEQIVDELNKANPSSEKIRMNLWLSTQQFSFLQNVSSRDGRTMSDIVRESLRDYMSKDKQIMGDKNAG